MRLSGRPRLSGAHTLVAAEVRTRHRDIYLAVHYAPAEVRPALMALFGLDLELATVVAGTTEAMIGEIRLAWWREALEGLDAGRVPAQPLLQALAGAVLPRGIGGAALAGLEDRWLGLIGSEDVPVAHVEGGGNLFALAAQLLGGDLAQARRLGTAWAGMTEFGERVAAPLRPLLGLHRLALRPADEPKGSAGRQLRLLAAVAFGR